MRLPIHEDFTSSQPGYARALARDLAEETSGEVRFDTGSRAAWSTDASNYRHVPIGVVLPRTLEDVVRVAETPPTWEAREDDGRPNRPGAGPAPK